MRRSKTDFLFHFVWATYRRTPLITPQIEAQVYGIILAEAKRLECHVLAIGGMPDHVHLAVKAPAKHGPSYLIKQIKGVSSTLTRQQITREDFFGWQDNYGGFSLCHQNHDRAIAYIQNQKEHHAQGTLDWEWEQTDEPVDP